MFLYTQTHAYMPTHIYISEHIHVPLHYPLKPSGSNNTSMAINAFKNQDILFIEIFLYIEPEVHLAIVEYRESTQ